MSQPQSFEEANIAPPPPARIRGVRIYLVILATIYVVASLALGVTAYLAAHHDARTIEQLQRQSQQLQRESQQLQRDTNDNLCEQQAYGVGSVCSGG